MLKSSYIKLLITILMITATTAGLNSHQALRADTPAAASTLPFINAKTILIVRHADTQTGSKKTMGNKNAPLAVPGVARAADLAATLKTFGITTLVASDCLRTQQTLQKLATTLNLKEDTTLKHGDDNEPGKDAPAASAAEKAAANQKEADLAVIHLAQIAHPTDVIAFCYHHNVIPLILGDLGFKNEPAFDDGEYDRLYIITPDADHHAYHMMRLRYGQKNYDGDKTEKGNL